jgi:chromosome segregation ATPase
MPVTSEHTHHIKLRSTQLEMPTRAGSSTTEDYDSKLQAAQDELDRIQVQREELERKKRELEELTARKRTFLSQQVELSEKLTSAVTLIERELYEIRQEVEDLEQCRTCFVSHVDKLDKINPEGWTRDNLAEKLERATMAVDMAADEYDQAASHFEHSRSGTIFGHASKRKRSRTKSPNGSEFLHNLRNGLAFNLPLYALGGAALIIYLLK